MIRSPAGEPLTEALAQPKRLALLAYLAAYPGRFRRRDALLGMFWPELDDLRGRHALNQAVRYLRASLRSPEPVIVSRGADELGVAPNALWCDVQAFVDSVNAGHTDEALTLYTGDLLEGFFSNGAPEFDDWLSRERSRLRLLAAGAASDAATQREGAGDLATAVRYAARAVELSPQDERMLRQRLRLLDLLGDRAAALREFDTFARRLAAEFEVEPAAETRELVERIRSRREPHDHIVEIVESRPVRVTPMLVDEPAPAVRAAPRPSYAWRAPRRVPILLVGAAICAFATVFAASRFEHWPIGSNGRLIPSNGTVDARAALTSAMNLDRETPRPRGHAIHATIAGMYRRAATLDSTYTAAWEGLAYALDLMLDEATSTDVIGIEREFNDVVSHVLRLDPGSSVAHQALGRYYFYHRGDLRAAKAEYLSSRLDDTSRNGILLAVAELNTGDVDQAAARALRAARSEHSPAMHLISAEEVLANARRYEDAARAVARVQKLYPANPGGYSKGLYLALDLGDTVVAAAEVEAAIAHIGASVPSLFLRYPLINETYARRFDDISLSDPRIESAFDSVRFLLVKARRANTLGHADEGRRFYDLARLLAERDSSIAGGADQIHNRLVLAECYAGVGRRGDALAEIDALERFQRKMRFNPAFDPSLSNQEKVTALLLIGDTTRALRAVDELLSNPDEITSAFIRIVPQWHGLHGNLDFERVLAGHPSPALRLAELLMPEP